MSTMEGVERPSKRAKLVMDDSDESDESNGLRELEPAGRSRGSRKEADGGFTVNEEYAKRYEHNKKREELHRLEEKYRDSNQSSRGRIAGIGGGDDGDLDSIDDDSTSEEEDDDAELATLELDQEIFATLKAIKDKDPKVYKKNIKFYRDIESDDGSKPDKESVDKPMYLHDYHRQNLMEGYTGADTEDKPVITYQEEQDALKRELVGSMHASKHHRDGDDSEDEEFLVAKSKPKHADVPTSKGLKITEEDVNGADRDPETYLSNFMAARAWLPKDGTSWRPLESDDSGDEDRADAFEEAYNMRFEDPRMANEKLQSFARDVGKYGVRREEKSRRKLAREEERGSKDVLKKERDEERARLRKLKVEEAEEKVRRIKKVAGIRGQELNLDQWRDIIEGDFDDSKWEQEMLRRFGEEYYAQSEGSDEHSDAETEGQDQKQRKARKPNWDDDIDIRDLVPDFNEENTDVQLTSDEEGEKEAGVATVAVDDANGEDTLKRGHKTRKDRMKDKADAKRVARKERAKLEEMIDASITVSHPDLAPSASSSKTAAASFRYRETSPTSFGLSARDILFAEDAQLNQFAGLKKLAAFRDEEKKRKDKKKFSKKARLRQWRKETFGNPEEPEGGFERVLGNEDYSRSHAKGVVKLDGKDGAKRKRRSKKKEKSGDEAGNRD